MQKDFHKITLNVMIMFNTYTLFELLDQNELKPIFKFAEML